MARRWALGALLLLAAWASTTPAKAETAHVLLLALEPDTYVSGEGDETIVLVNDGAAAADVGGWRIRDSTAGSCTSSEGILEFPGGATIGPGERIHVTQNASAFTLDRLGAPDWEWLVDADASVPQLDRICGRLTLANAQDEVQLLDASGQVMDAVVYGGAARPVEGWSGDPVPDPSEGLVLERNHPEAGGTFPDTDAAPDWDDLRLVRIGQSHWDLSTFAFDQATVCASPDASFETVKEFVEGTTTSLHVELYEWTNPHLVEAFQNVLDQGVEVRVLVEGGPVGLLAEERDQQNWILDQLAQRGGDVAYMITNATQGIHDRYAFVHAKYAVRDHEDVLVMSGNWKPTGLPTDPTFGNREWCLIVHAPDLAVFLEKVQSDDADRSEYRDVIAFGAGTDERYLPPPPDFSPNLTIPTGTYAPVFPAEAFGDLDASVTPILSPDTSLFQSSTASLLSRIRNAQAEVLVEQMTFHKHWGNSTCDETCLAVDPSPLLDAVVEAARNGARVRVLLGDEFLDPADTRDNTHTREHLNDVAGEEGLNLVARIVDSRVAEFLKVHNKGVLIDDAQAYVGSMNWGRASAQDNREVGLLVESPEVASYFEELFWFDWSPLENKPPTNLVAVDVALDYDPLAPGTNPPSPAAAHVRVTVANNATRGAGDFNVTVTLRGFAQSATLETRVPFLGAGASMVVELAWDATLAAGTFDLEAFVDARGEIPETSEEDNAVDGTAIVLAPSPGVWVPGLGA